MLETAVCEAADEKTLGIDNSVSISEDSSDIKERMRALVKHCNGYKGAYTGQAVFQLLSTVGLFLVSSAVMIYAHDRMLWLTLLLTLPTAGLLVRIFIIQHDCGHGSFFNSKFWNDMTGRFLSVFTFTPYEFWRRAHNMHHASSGSLERRGVGAIDTLTVREYKDLSSWKRFQYRMYRNPFVLLVFGTPFYTLIIQRFPMSKPPEFAEVYTPLPIKKVWKSVIGLDIALLAVYGGFIALFGLKPLLIVILPMLMIAGAVGGWLFYIQHQFEHTYWEHDDKWNFAEAAVMSSSYYDLPKVLQWFTGNIGLHHIHHLCSAIPNYRLQECMDSHAELPKINRMTFRDSLKCLRWRLWDEDLSKMVTFGDMKAVIG